MQTMNNGREIERRWVIKHLPHDLVDTGKFLHIFQYYTPTGRYRYVTPHKNFVPQHSDEIYYRTLKTYVAPGINDEAENSVTKQDFEEVIKTAKSMIRKYRYLFDYGGLTFEFDGLVLDDKDNYPTLWIMEVELKSMDQHIDMPDSIRKVLIKEVTGDKVWSNYSLSKLL